MKFSPKSNVPETSFIKPQQRESLHYVLFFIHLKSRRVHLAGMTPNPDGQWMAQVARNMSMVFAEEPTESRPTHIIRDRDSKFTAEFCSILETDGIEFRPTPRRSPVTVNKSPVFAGI